MQYYKSLSELIKNYKSLAYPGGIYMEGVKKENYSDSQFWVLSSKEEKNEYFEETEYGSVPKSLKEFNVCQFMDAGTFQDIIENKLDHQPDLSLENTELFGAAINYYLTEDDFQD